MAKALSLPLYLNREWSWLQFNERVLEEAEDPTNPLLERVKFLAIFARNLDEFFMIRAAGLYRQVDAKLDAQSPDGLSPRRQLEGIAQICQVLTARQQRLWDTLAKALVVEGVGVVGIEQLGDSEKGYAQRYYQEVVYPVITPMIVDPKHPFPTVQNNTLYLLLRLRQQKVGAGFRRLIGFVAIPKVLPRFVLVHHNARAYRFVPLESLMVAHAESLFSGYDVQAINALRVTRDADIALDEETAEDLRRAMARKVLGRRHGAAVRLEHGSRLSPKVERTLRDNLEVDPEQFYAMTGLMQAADLFQLYDAVDRPDLKFKPAPVIQVGPGRHHSIFEWLRAAPRLLHHPFHSFDVVSEMLMEAAEDPAVLAIKQTLYRTSGNSPIVRALTKAAENGKQVTAVVELRARFDEERNIEWARRLEQAGAHVVYGLVGYKTHCKALLIVRRDADGIRRYVHLGTGNYNDTTARLYTDMGLLTMDDQLGEDISALFNVITGATQPPTWNKIEMSPIGLRRRLLHLIGREIDKSATRARGRIIAKMNSLVDPEIIQALYDASAAGVQVQLIVRGICCLRPGIKGLSENIHVRSIVGRYLEHTRVFWFRNGGQDEFYLSSADWMTRNLDRRIEIMFPIEDPQHQDYLRAALQLQLRDNRKARELTADSVYRHSRSGEGKVSSQEALFELTASTLNYATKAGFSPQLFA